jgi:hypothetical protein
MYAVVVTVRSGFKNMYAGGKQNFKNWRDFYKATPFHETEEEAWKHFRRIGAFDSFSGKRMSASIYTRSSWSKLMEDGLLDENGNDPSRITEEKLRAAIKLLMEE